MTKVSSGKKKSGPPAHPNTYPFHHNKSSKLTLHILSLPITNLCPICTQVIEWRKKFRKYKPLTVVKRCTSCGEKRVKDAYHVICEKCVTGKNVCAKCLESRDLDASKLGKKVELLDNESEGEGEGKGKDEKENESRGKNKCGQENELEGKLGNVSESEPESDLDA